jgi:hypothetical protein
MIAARVGEQRAVELKFVKRRPLAAIRSRVGVGTTPPNVLVTPKPVSSVIIKRMFGAPAGGTTRAGHQGVDCAALRSILPSNFCGGGGSWLPGIVVVALGEPAAPVISCASAAEVSAVAARRASVMASRFVFMGNLPTLVATHLACSEHSPHQRRFDETAAREIDPSELADARRITYSLGDLVRSNFSRSSLPGQFCTSATWTLVAALSESTWKRTPCKHRRGAWKPLRVSTDRETLRTQWAF